MTRSTTIDTSADNRKKRTVIIIIKLLYFLCKPVAELVIHITPQIIADPGKCNYDNVTCKYGHHKQQ